MFVWRSSTANVRVERELDVLVHGPPITCRTFGVLRLHLLPHQSSGRQKSPAKMDTKPEQESTRNASTPSHFLSLPRELRDAIYELCLLHPPVIDIVRGEHPEWLLTSKQIFQEAAPMVYNQACLYKAIAWEDSPNLLDQLSTGYSLSYPNCDPTAVQESLERVKRMIFYIAIDLHLDMTAEQLTWLAEHYLAGIEDLTNLQALYVSLNVRSGSEGITFKRQLHRSDLRVFHIVRFVEPVKLLLDRLPKRCKVRWRVPESIRWSANGGSFDYTECNAPFMNDFMWEVEQAVAATEPQPGEGEVQRLAGSMAGMGLKGDNGVTQ